MHFFFFIGFLFSFGNSLSNTHLIFLADININSTSDNLELVLGFGVTWYTLKNGWISSMNLFPSNFFNAHLKVSTNLSACPLDCKCYFVVVMCTIGFTKIFELFCCKLCPIIQYQNTKSSKEFMQKSNCTTVCRVFTFHNLWLFWETVNHY